MNGSFVQIRQFQNVHHHTVWIGTKEISPGINFADWVKIVTILLLQDIYNQVFDLNLLIILKSNKLKHMEQNISLKYLRHCLSTKQPVCKTIRNEEMRCCWSTKSFSNQLWFWCCWSFAIWFRLLKFYSRAVICPSFDEFVTILSIIWGHKLQIRLIM